MSCRVGGCADGRRIQTHYWLWAVSNRYYINRRGDKWVKLCTSTQSAWLKNFCSIFFLVLDHVDEITLIVFQYIHLVRQQGVQKWVFDEVKGAPFSRAPILLHFFIRPCVDCCNRATQFHLSSKETAFWLRERIGGKHAGTLVWYVIVSITIISFVTGVPAWACTLWTVHGRSVWCRSHSVHSQQIHCSGQYDVSATFIVVELTLCFA
jgi:hypothetical protein